MTAPSTKANLNLNSSQGVYFSGSSTPSDSQIASVCGVSSSQIGSLLCQFTGGGDQGGLLKTSYTCSSSLNTFDYISGDYAGATCLIVQCGSSGCYVFNLSKWNGTDEIDCSLYGRPTECYVYGQCKTPTGHSTSPVPEPSTIIAGLGLLVPLGIQTFRQFRKRHQTVQN